MLTRFARVGVITVLAVLSSVIVADAQSTPQSAPIWRQLPTRPGNGSFFPPDANGAVRPQGVGWNYVHIANCTVYASGGVFFLAMQTLEGPYFYTGYDGFKGLVYPACQTGNLVAFYVINSFGDWNQIYTYTYR
jgi:hypothetical protein